MSNLSELTSMVVGYKLVRVSDGVVIDQRGGVWGQSVSAPNPFFLPNGDVLWSPAMCIEYGNYRIDPWIMDRPPPSERDVEVERERRLSKGFVYEFADSRGRHVLSTSGDDLVGWNEVTSWAVAHAGTDATTTISTQSGTAIVTPEEWMTIVRAMSTWRQGIWNASFRLQRGTIPEDYRDDVHWTS